MSDQKPFEKGLLPYQHLSPYYARVIEKIDNGKGYWKYTRMGVFEGEKQIGEYIRKYQAFGEQTFHPFRQGDQWYALYSADYTTTRVMTLPDCKDIGGEDHDSAGFCPVEYFIPTWYNYTYLSDYERGVKLETPKRNTVRMNNPDVKEAEGKEIFWYNFGFIAGCVWGDDSSWKLQYLDLSDPRNIKRIEKFGYLELPHNQTLREAISLEYYAGDYPNIRINTQFSFDMRTGLFEKHYLPFEN